MLVGHFAMGLLGKRAAPALSIGTLTLASMLADMLGSVFIVIGLEHWRVVPGGRGIDSMDLYDIGLSHSLAMDIVWGALFAALYWWRRRDMGAAMVFIAVSSHWVLDWISHKPDMPLAPGTTDVHGLGLWTSVLWTVVVEGGLWLVGLVVYVRMTRAKNRAGIYVFWAGVALLTLSWIPNFTASAPPTTSPTSGAIVILGFFSVMIAWAYWMNRLRRVHLRG